MTTPKKHHFLPQFYLRGFRIQPQASKFPHIWMIRKAPYPKSISAPIGDTGCIADYHTLDKDPMNKDRSSLEKVFQKGEDEQARAIREVLECKCISPKNKAVLALFVSIMRCRVPSFKRSIEKSLQNTLRSTSRMMLRSGRCPPPPPEIVELMKEYGDDIFRFEISNWMLLFQMVTAGVKSNAPAILKRMSYSLIEATEGAEFVTCDSPVSLYVPKYEARKPYGVGLLDKEVEVAIPLTRQFLLMASWRDMPSHQVVGGGNVREFNRRTIITCDRYVYASSVFKGLIDQVSSLHTYSSGFDQQSLDYGRGCVHVSRFIPVSDDLDH
jgi:hypothetical protein